MAYRVIVGIDNRNRRGKVCNGWVCNLRRRKTFAIGGDPVTFVPGEAPGTFAGGGGPARFEGGGTPGGGAKEMPERVDIVGYSTGESRRSDKL
jgi:hypothetical protein